MKPRLYKQRGLWHCCIRVSNGYVGLGYTPRMAYDDWKAFGLTAGGGQ